MFIAAEQRLKSSQWYAILILLTCVEAALPAYGAHTWYVTYVPLSYTTYVTICRSCVGLALHLQWQMPLVISLIPFMSATSQQHSSSIPKHSIWEHFLRDLRFIVAWRRLTHNPSHTGCKLAFDTTNYWNPHILILVGALPNHRRDQHSIFSKRKGLTSLSYFKYNVGYF